MFFESDSYYPLLLSIESDSYYPGGFEGGFGVEENGVGFFMHGEGETGNRSRGCPEPCTNAAKHMDTRERQALGVEYTDG